MNVDIVIPCYNYGRFLEQCVSSVLAQSGVEVRILIIDDASTDNTADIAERLAHQDFRVSVRHHTVNNGNIATYNEGIAWASADLFLLLSADDYLVDGALARAAAVFAAHQNVVLLCGNADVATDGMPPPHTTPVAGMGSYEVLDGQTFIERACSSADSNPVWTPTAVVRTRAQKQVGGYDPALPHAGDLELWLRLACLGTVAILRACQAVYRRHDANMQYSFAGLANLRQHLLAFESYLAKFGVSAESARQQRDTFRRALAVGAVRVANHAMNSRSPEIVQEALAFAVQMDSEVSGTWAWRGMRTRAIFGPRVVAAARCLKRALSALACSYWRSLKGGDLAICPAVNSAPESGDGVP